MSISEKANDLLNKFGSAQFDFMIWNTPDNLVARDKARQEISDYIAELEAENDQLTAHSDIERQDDKWIPEVQESEAASCKWCGSNKSDRRMNSIVCSSCGRKIGNVAPPEVQE